MHIERQNLNPQVVLEMLDWFEAKKTRKEIAKNFFITERAVAYQKNKYGIRDRYPDTIDRARLLIQARMSGNPDYPYRNYTKQAGCIPEKFFFQCHSCKFTGSENNVDEVLEHINRYKEKLKVGVRVFDLTDNKVGA